MEGQGTANIKYFIEGQKILWVWVGFFFSFLFSSLSFFCLSYFTQTCNTPGSVWVGWGFHLFYLFVSYFWAGTCSGCWVVCVCILNQYLPVRYIFSEVKPVEYDEDIEIHQLKLWDDMFIMAHSKISISFLLASNSEVKHFESLIQAGEKKLLHVVLIDFRVKRESRRKETWIQIILRKVKLGTIFQSILRKHMT